MELLPTHEIVRIIYNDDVMPFQHLQQPAAPTSEPAVPKSVPATINTATATCLRTT